MFPFIVLAAFIALTAFITHRLYLPDDEYESERGGKDWNEAFGRFAI